tara:strand:+ start:15440 stop:15751 length:312 start_codon:yes stop_codon:yes gene_type:complete
MINLIYFILTAYGLTQILVYGKLFDSIRPARGKLKKLFECPMCMGFWVGAFLFGINRYTELFTFEYKIANLFILGWLSSGTSYILNMVFGDNGVKHEYKYLDK